MSVLRHMLAWDARLHYRYGVLAAGAWVTLVWIAVLWALSDDLQRLLAPAVLFGDTAIFGLFLLSGMVFLEKGDRVLDALVVTPLGRWRYLAAQITPLWAVSVVIGVVIAWTIVGVRSVHWPLLVAGLGLATMFMMLVGFALSARFRSINEYILPSALVLAPAQIPLLHYFGVWEPGGMWLLPTQAHLVLIRGAFHGLTGQELAYGLSYSVVSMVPAVWLAGRGFERFLTGAGRDRPRRRVGRTRKRPVAGETRSAQRSPMVALALGDLRNVAREPIMLFMAIYAMVLAVLARIVVPLVGNWLDGTYGIAIEPYHPLVVSFFAVLANPMLLGSVVGLLLLDERDEGSLQALRATPLTMARYAMYRTLVPVLISVVFAFASVWIIAAVIPPWPLLLPVALLAALEAPITALAVASTARNKVEGLAVLKGLGIFIIAPAAAWFVAFPWRWLFAPLPTWWVAEAFWRAAGTPGDVLPILIGGAAIHGALLIWLARRFTRQL